MNTSNAATVGSLFPESIPTMDLASGALMHFADANHHLKKEAKRALQDLKSDFYTIHGIPAKRRAAIIRLALEYRLKRLWLMRWGLLEMELQDDAQECGKKILSVIGCLRQGDDALINLDLVD